MQLSEKIKSNSGDLIMFGVFALVVLIGFGFARDIWHVAQAEMSQQKLDESASKSVAGLFAVENFTACKKARGAFSSPASDAQCITETVNGAEKLKGPQFSAQVTHELAEWLEKSKKLHAQ